MGKRKLTRRQAWRVNKIQDERRKRADARDQMAEDALDSGGLGAEQEGLVVAHYGSQVLVEAGGSSSRCHLRANLDSLVTGDRVIWCRGEPLGVVVARQQRESELLRPDPYGKLKPVAANIDQIIVVIAPLPEPHAHVIDRYLVAAAAVNIAPLILLNKSDLVDAANRDAIEDLLAPYPALGYPVLDASCTNQDGLQALLTALKGKSSVFVGQSGVGKSSLVNALLPEVDIRVGELSETRQEGTHTTTTAQLYHLPDGGDLIDSPGIREFGLWHMEREQVEQGFREFEPLLGRCKFRDCKHQQEPACALLEAAARGEISDRRLQSYRDIIASLQDSERF
ncbi:MAG: small ribosomal subunit biogenesis GTPase RsgA [Halieaceae bacterium]